MFRTRDFILLFTTIVFLISAIGATIFGQWLTGESVWQMKKPTTIHQVASTSDVVFAASVSNEKNIDRVGNAERLRSRLIEQRVVDEIKMAAERKNNPVALPAAATTTATTSAEVVDDKKPEPESTTPQLVCSGYSPYAGFWDVRNLSVEERSGFVLVEREIDGVTDMVLQLPTGVLPSLNATCLSSDVIGVANDGSLIRNDEALLYGIFDNSVRVGYALDGVPIYGSGSSESDECGGRFLNGQYRYEVSSNRESVINCFVGQPVSLP